MSELIQKNDNRATIRWKLLTSASALALTVSAMNVAKAEEADRSSIWIEVGGQFDQFNGQGSPFTPSFVNTFDWSAYNLTSPATIQNMHVFSLGGDASITFQPTDSDWIFSASVRYGRSHGHKFKHQQKTQHTRFQFIGTGPLDGKYVTKTLPASYAQTGANKSEHHLVADFQAGKDVGLGMFGRDSTSVFGVGVRFARMSEKAQAAIYARPGIYIVPGTLLGKYPSFPFRNNYDRYYAAAHRAASFSGVGPSISWNSSVPVAGNVPDGEITVDWGANAALLFGRQRAKTQHHTTGDYHYRSGKYYKTAALQPHTGHRTQSRSVIVPNLGGFAGISFRYANAKMSIGYRGDFFFGAMDNGFDTRKSDTRGYYGPFASISFGLGD
jgi:iron complex outermembrane recepter protein